METVQAESELLNNSIRLDHEWVQVLINLRMKYARSFTGKRHSATTAWDEILREMHELGAPRTISRLKIKKKWMNLIAKYKQLKSDPDAKKQSTWPYFDQIDRSYVRNQIGNKEANGIFNINHLLDDSNKYTEKENFMRTLIDLRYKYRHLFTGKKYAAQKGWMVIQNYLPSSEKYSVDQIRKVWHNLVQRYKTLAESVPDHTKITWTYFQQLHKIMSNESTSSIEFVDQKSMNISNTAELLANKDHNPFENITSDESSEIVPFLTDCDEHDNTDQTETELIGPNIEIIGEPEPLPVENKYKPTTSLDDLLDYLKERDQRRDEQFRELLGVMQDILLHLKK